MCPVAVCFQMSVFVFKLEFIFRLLLKAIYFLTEFI